MARLAAVARLPQWERMWMSARRDQTYELWLNMGCFRWKWWSEKEEVAVEH